MEFCLCTMNRGIHGFCTTTTGQVVYGSHSCVKFHIGDHKRGRRVKNTISRARCMAARPPGRPAARPPAARRPAACQRRSRGCPRDAVGQQAPSAATLPRGNCFVLMLDRLKDQGSAHDFKASAAAFATRVRSDTGGFARRWLLWWGAASTYCRDRGTTRRCLAASS